MTDNIAAKKPRMTRLQKEAFTREELEKSPKWPITITGSQRTDGPILLARINNVPYWALPGTDVEVPMEVAIVAWDRHQTSSRVRMGKPPGADFNMVVVGENPKKIALAPIEGLSDATRKLIFDPKKAELAENLGV